MMKTQKKTHTQHFNFHFHARRVLNFIRPEKILGAVEIGYVPLADADTYIRNTRGGVFHRLGRNKMCFVSGPPCVAKETDDDPTPCGHGLGAGGCTMHIHTIPTNAYGQVQPVYALCGVVSYGQVAEGIGCQSTYVEEERIRVARTRR